MLTNRSWIDPHRTRDLQGKSSLSSPHKQFEFGDTADDAVSYRHQSAKLLQSLFQAKTDESAVVNDR